MTAYVANANNQYTAISEDGAQHEPDYDKSGNLLHDATRKFTWDADIHLLSVETKAEGGAPRVPAGLETRNSKSSIQNRASSIESFRYDALHRRVARAESATGTTTLFIHDGWNVVAEYQSSPALQRAPQSSPGLQPAAASPQDKAPASHAANADGLKPKTTFLAARHVWGEDLSRTMQGAGGIGGLLASTHFGAQAASPITDHGSPITSLFASYDSNGNVLLLTDALCRTAAKYRYDAFGQTISATGPAANLNRYRFSTKPVEVASGLAFYGYRYYDPQTGRWPSRDPIEERGGINLYATSNNAVSHVDVLGAAQFEFDTYPFSAVGPDDPRFVDPSADASTQRLCGTAIYDLATQGCCGGVIYSLGTGCCTDGQVGTRRKQFGAWGYHSHSECVDALCSNIIIEEAKKCFNEISPLTPYEDASTVTGTLLGVVNAPAGIVAGAPSFAQAGTRLLASSLCRYAASLTCNQDVCDDSSD